MLSNVTPTFLGAESATDPTLVRTAYAFLGIPFGPPYEGWEYAAASKAPDVLREVTQARAYTRFINHWNFDIGEPQYEDGRPDITDLGNVAGDVRRPETILGEAVKVLSPLVRNGVVPLVMGGLDSVPPMVVAAFEGVEDINILHVDAHIDFRDEIYGRRDGYSSPIRRIREFSFVHDIVQVGARSIGSARREEVEAAIAMGNRIVTAWQVHEEGAHTVAATLDPIRRWVIVIDCDGMDPTVAPAVGAAEPGGLSFVQTATLLRHLARNNLVAGVVFTEFQPAKDINDLTALAIIRLLLNVVGLQRQPARLA
ncbi:arginase family protein [Mesorhizobium sp. CO1-1-8]|uniref:arginase family protein n=1 Tax=Mesorhizobium sp. CO1-1-8 TaxID=2876631 RepID=UPI001CD0F78C|nr:arginase family protein [Mesorhizobium sp. CO1-1-8]MBZ9772535.1 arginase family protein [Mesorhizobium sp. CO1-1-8]